MGPIALKSTTCGVPVQNPARLEGEVRTEIEKGLAVWLMSARARGRSVEVEVAMLAADQFG